MEKIRTAAHVVVESALLIVVTRAVTLIGIPLLLAWLYWTTGSIAAIAQRMAVLETSRIQGRAEIIGRIERLEQSDTRDRETLSGLQREISGVAATTQAILREIETMRREAILREQRRAGP